MKELFLLSVLVSIICYAFRGYDRNINTLYRAISIHLRCRWINRTNRITDRFLFRMTMILTAITYITITLI